MKTIKFMFLALMMCFTVLTFGQQNTNLQTKTYVSNVAVYKFKPDTNAIKVNDIRMIVVSQDMNSKTLLVNVTGENGVKFYVEYNQTFYNYNNTGTTIASYKGVDEGGDAVVINYMTTSDFSVSAIMVTSNTYSVAYYIGY